MSSEEYKTIDWLKKRVKQLQKKPQPEQRTEAWFKQRQTRITASEAASCLFKNKKTCQRYVEIYGIKNFRYRDTEGINPYESRDEYIIKKCRSFYGESVFKDNPFTIWGKRYENIATRLYCKHFKTEVYEFGLLNHNRLKWLAASPDGITPAGIMLEIKCPKSRKIDAGAPPFYYYCQTQVQLEVADLEQCDFLECEINEMTEDEWLSQNDEQKYSKESGILIQLPTKEGEEFKYIYPPLELDTKHDYINWQKEMLSENPGAISLYWNISRWNVIHIKRDRVWFDNVKDEIKNTWKIITRLQNDQEEFFKYKDAIDSIKNKDFIERWTKTDCLISDNNSTFILEENQSEQDLIAKLDQILLGPSPKEINEQNLLGYHQNNQKDNQQNNGKSENEQQNSKSESIECLID